MPQAADSTFKDAYLGIMYWFLPAATLGAVGLGEGKFLCPYVRTCRLGQICGKMINVRFLADIWIFGQLMVIFGK